MHFEPEPHQDLESDDSGSQEKDLPEIPTNFLSPSVREYLELGKSIPGKNQWHWKSNLSARIILNVNIEY